MEQEDKSAQDYLDDVDLDTGANWCKSKFYPDLE